MKLLAKAQTSQRRLIEILRVIKESDKPIGARAISDELSNRGYDIGERAVRYNLKILDELGFTKKEGYSGRSLTPLGNMELGDALVDDRIGFVNTRIEECMYQSSFDPKSAENWVVVNTSILGKNDYEKALEIIKEVFNADYTVSRRIRIQDEGAEIGLLTVPKGSIAISNVCSITIDGMLLRAGIPVNTSFAGIVEIKNGKPAKFIDLIAYVGSSLDPMKVFMSRKTARVTDAVKMGKGSILANLREVPLAATDQARQLLQECNAVDLGGLINISEPGETNMACPVGPTKIGIVICAGVNALVAVEEAGIPIRTMPISSLEEYSKMSRIE